MRSGRDARRRRKIEFRKRVLPRIFEYFARFDRYRTRHRPYSSFKRINDALAGPKIVCTTTRFLQYKRVLFT